MEQIVTEKAVISRLYEEIHKIRYLRDDQIKRLAEIFGSRFQSAYKAIQAGKVKKYLFHPSERVVWIVAGKEGEYQVLPRIGFCSCNDFYFRVVGHDAFLCYHLIAQELAEALEGYVLVEKPDEACEPLMEVWRKIKVEKRRLPLGEVENVRRVVEAILSEEGELSISQLLEEVRKTGFHSLTGRHLSNIMVADKRKRFKCRRELWILIKDSASTR